MSNIDASDYDNVLNNSGDGNLIPKAQINDVLRNLNIRENLFNDDDINQLENGYSVSDTDEEGVLANNADIMSLRSGLSGNNVLVGGTLLNSPDMKLAMQINRNNLAANHDGGIAAN